MGYFIIAIIAFGTGITLGYFAFYGKPKKLEELKTKLDKQKTNLDERFALIRQKETDFTDWETRFQKFKDKIISFDDLHEENTILKTDLQNIDVECRKLKLDYDLQDQRQDAIGQRTDDLGQRYLKENIKWIGSKLTTNNFVNSKANLIKVIERCRGIGFDIPVMQEQEFLADLKEEYEKVLRADFERQEQARIKAQIREEQKLEKKSKGSLIS